MKKENKRKIRNIVLIAIDIVVILLVIYFVFGYLNFFQISKEKNPVFELESPTTYKLENSNNIVKVYDYKVYKIVKVKTETPKKAVTYSMKLWFMKDVK